MSLSDSNNSAALSLLKEAISEYLTNEERKIIAQRDYLLAIQDALSGGTSTESASSAFVSVALFSEVSAFLPETEE